MTSEARASAVTRGASMVLEQEHVLVQIKKMLGKVSFRSLGVPLVIVLFIGVLLTPKGWLVSAIDHEIEQFQIHGELNNLSVGAIESKLSNWMGQSFLTTDLQQIKADVESLAWVHKATVSRVWPGQVVLSLTEQTPVAYWNENAFLNGDGDVFAPQVIAQDRDLPLLIGPGDSEQFLRAEMLAEMAQLQRLLAPYLLSAKSLEVNDRGSWAMTLENGIHVALGSRPFESKVERLATVLNNETNKEQIMESIDTRYPNGVAVKWKELAIAARDE